MGSDPEMAKQLLDSLPGILTTSPAITGDLFLVYLSLLDSKRDFKKELLDGFVYFIKADPDRLEEYLQHLIVCSRNSSIEVKDKIAQIILDLDQVSQVLFDVIVAINNRFVLNRDVECAYFVIDNIFMNSSFVNVHREQLLNHFASAIFKADVDNRIHKRYLEASLVLFNQQIYEMDKWFISIFNPDSFYDLEGSMNALALNKVFTYHSKDLLVSKQVDNEEVKVLLNRFIMPLIHRLLRHPNVPSSRTKLPPFTREQCGEGYNVLMIACARMINMIPECEVKEVTELLYDSLVAFIPDCDDVNESVNHFMPFGHIAAILTAIHNLGYVFPEIVSKVLGDPLSSKSAFEDVSSSKRKVEMQKLLDCSTILSRRLEEAEKLLSFKYEEVTSLLQAGRQDSSLIQQTINLAMLDHGVQAPQFDDHLSTMSFEELEAYEKILNVQLEAVRRSRSSVDLITKKSKPLALFDDPRYDIPIWERTSSQKAAYKPKPRTRKEDFNPKSRKIVSRPRDNSHNKY